MQLDNKRIFCYLTLFVVTSVMYSLFKDSFIVNSQLLYQYSSSGQAVPYLLHWKYKESTVKYDIAITSCGNTTSRHHEAVVTLKSALLLVTTETVVFHIFATPNAKKFIEKRLLSLPQSVRAKFEYIFYDPYFPSKTWLNMFALCSTQRLFIFEKITSAKHLLYMDSDSMLLAPLKDVWREFDNFTDTQFVGMTYNTIFMKGWYDSHVIPHPPPHGLNAGILLLDMEKMRQHNWVDNMTHIMKVQNEEKTNRLGDQDLLNEYFYYFPERFKTMGCILNYRTDNCRAVSVKGVKVKQTCLDAEYYGVVIAHASRKQAHRGKPNIFSVIYDAIEKYNFTTNVGKGFIKPLQTTIDRYVKENTRFKKSICSKQAFLFLRNLLKFAHANNPNDTFYANHLKDNKKLSDPRVKADVKYYLKKNASAAYLPHVEKRKFPGSALMPLNPEHVRKSQQAVREKQAAKNSTQPQATSKSTHQQAAKNSTQQQVTSKSTQQQASRNSTQPQATSKSAQQQAAKNSIQQQASRNNTQQLVTSNSTHQQVAQNSTKKQKAKP